VAAEHGLDHGTAAVERDRGQVELQGGPEQLAREVRRRARARRRIVAVPAAANELDELLHVGGRHDVCATRTFGVVAAMVTGSKSLIGS
jgi:hypothetical protein